MLWILTNTWWHFLVPHRVVLLPPNHLCSTHLSLSPLIPTNHQSFQCLQSFAFPECHRLGIIQYVAFTWNVCYTHSSDSKESIWSARDWVLSLGWKDSPGERNATHSSIPAWKIPWTEEPGGLQLMRSRKSQVWLVIKQPPPQSYTQE